MFFAHARVKVRQCGENSCDMTAKMHVPRECQQSVPMQAGQPKEIICYADRWARPFRANGGGISTAVVKLRGRN
jgi:hypothetical protein